MARVALIADDHEVSRLAFSAILLRRLSYDRVEEAPSLDEALELLSSLTQISLALIDLIMPGISTAASIGAVRELHPHLKVVIISSSSDRENIMHALAAGVHGYIVKDSGVAEIVKALELIEAGGVYVPAALANPPAVPSANPFSSAGRAVSLATMTSRQNDVLRLLVTGQPNKEIARRLKISEGTAKLHVAAVLRLLNVKNRAAAAVLGTRLLDSPESDHHHHH